MIVGIAIILLVGLAMSWLAGTAMSRGHAAPVPPAIAPATDLRIRTNDGLTLAATYRPGARADSPAVLLLHGVGASRAAMADNAAWLSRQGYATLAIDFRGHGGSSVTPRSFGLYEARDARAAFDWLKRRQHGARVAILGISLGGAASLIGEDGPIPADALVLQAVYPDIRHAIRNRIATLTGRPIAMLLEPLLSLQSRLRFGVWPGRLSPIDAVARYPGPVLVIGGVGDRATPPDETRALHAAAPGRRGLWLAPSGDHGEVCGLDDDVYRTRLLDFLRATIG